MRTTALATLLVPLVTLAACTMPGETTTVNAGPGPTALQPVQGGSGPTRPILVMRRNLDVGQELTADDVRVVTWPAPCHPPYPVASSPADVVGFVATSRLEAREPVGRHRIRRAANWRGLSHRIAPGTRGLVLALPVDGPPPVPGSPMALSTGGSATLLHVSPPGGDGSRGMVLQVESAAAPAILARLGEVTCRSTPGQGPPPAPPTAPVTAPTSPAPEDPGLPVITVVTEVDQRAGSLLTKQVLRLGRIPEHLLPLSAPLGFDDVIGARTLEPLKGGEILSLRRLVGPDEPVLERGGRLWRLSAPAPLTLQVDAGVTVMKVLEPGERPLLAVVAPNRPPVTAPALYLGPVPVRDSRSGPPDPGDEVGLDFDMHADQRRLVESAMAVPGARCFVVLRSPDGE